MRAMIEKSTWIETMTQAFWKKKDQKLQLLMNNAVERFSRRVPEIEKFTLQCDEFRLMWPKMTAEAEDFAAEEMVLGHVNRREMETLRDALVIALGQRLPEIKDQSMTELGGKKEIENAAPRRRGRPRTRSL